MKYLFFLTGLALFGAALVLNVNGALTGWDAAVTAAPFLVGVALMGMGVGIHVYDNWRAK